MSKRSFVIHEHKSDHGIHFDLRLEIGTVLKSWMLTKGPSLDPSLARLAVEDGEYPLTYMSFEGDIDQDLSSVTGELIIWDRGNLSFESPAEESFSKGKLEFFLEGEKLKGAFKIEFDSEENTKRYWILRKVYDSFVSYSDIVSEQPGSIISLRRFEP